MNVSFEEFKKIDLRIATIEAVDEHPNADRLYVLQLKVGDIKKQIVAGIRAHYTAQELIGKQIVIVNNLEPVTLRGVESQGMLLATSNDEMLSILIPERTIGDGAQIK